MKTLKQLRQDRENEIVLEHMNSALKELRNNVISVKRLRTCSATVYETENYYVLKSYSTFIACVPKFEHYCVDFLRKVYRYTATSAQHITKFHYDYAYRETRFTYR